MAEPSTSSIDNLKRSSSENINILKEITESFKNETIKEILKLNFQDNKTKINEDCAQLMSEVMKLIVTDMVLRASQIAFQEFKTTISVEYIEAIIPHIMLDYP